MEGDVKEMGRGSGGRKLASPWGRVIMTGPKSERHLPRPAPPTSRKGPPSLSFRQSPIFRSSAYDCSRSHFATFPSALHASNKWRE